MSITLNLQQASELFAFFGGEDAEVVVNQCESGHSGPGIYVHIDGHPEEGSIKLTDDLDQPLSDDLWAWLTDGVTGIDGPRRGPVADGSQTPNDAAAIPCAKAGSNTGAAGVQAGDGGTT